MVAAHSDTEAGMHFGAALTDENVAGDDDLSAEFFHAEALAAGIATVLDGALSFFMGPGSRWLGMSGSARDRGDLEGGQTAAVAFGFVETLAALEFEGDFLGSAVLVDDLHGD